MKIWTLAYDDDTGTRADVFTTKAAADEAALRWVSFYSGVYPEVDFEGGNWEHIFEQLCEYGSMLDTIVMTEHDLASAEQSV